MLDTMDAEKNTAVFALKETDIKTAKLPYHIIGKR